jgi:predicted AAA+ superfamily ATPase
MQALALRCGQLLNESEVGRDVGLSQATAHRYTRLLEVGGLFVPIPAFGRNRTLRLMKRPKAMWVDPGLACFLAGLHDPGALRASREAGRMFEALVFLHLRGQGQVLRPRPRIHHWRTTAGVECDFVLEQGRNLVAVEAKLSSRIDYRDADDLETFLREYPEATAGLVVYSGRAIRRLSEKVVAIPWWL